MLEIERKNYIFKTKEIWFSDYPFDVDGCHSAIFHACKNKVDLKIFECKESPTFLIDLTQDLETIWKSMGKKSCRYGIKRAERDKVRVKINQDFVDFLKINDSFREAKGLSQSNINIEFIKKYGTLFVAEFEGEILGGQFYLADENSIRWLIGASKRLEVDRERAILIGNANRLITWEAIKYAKGRGLKEFDMGGYYSGGKGAEIVDTPNLFKQEFGGKVTTRYIYKKDYSILYKVAQSAYQLKQNL